MNPTRDDRAWRRIAIGSFLTLLGVTLAWNASAYAIDASGLDHGDSWPMVLGSMMVTIFYGTTPLVLSVVAALVGGLSTPELARSGAWMAVVIDAICAAALLLATGLLVGGSDAEAAFGVVSLFSATVLLLPGWLCIRQASNERVRD